MQQVESRYFQLNRGQFRLEHADVPMYPEPAHGANVFGTVEVQVTVRDGNVVSTEVKSGPPLLKQPTVENIRTWHFAYHADATFTTKFVYEIATDVDPANPKVELQLPYLAKITGIHVSYP